MRVHDISVAVTSDMARWEDMEGPILQSYRHIEHGDDCNASRLTIDLHAGTHVDAPYHFLSDGRRVDEIDLEACCGRCYVAETDAAILSASALEALNLPDVPRVLFKTNNSGLYRRGRFFPDYVAFDPSGAEWLVQSGVTLVGIDYLSIERYAGLDGSVHRSLLSRNIVVLEGLDLSRITPGYYILCALPVKIARAEAAPVRAVLLEDAA